MKSRDVFLEQNFKMAADTSTTTGSFNLERWLKVIEASHYTAAFTGHGLVSYERCINISEDDARAVGMNDDDDVRLLMDRIKELRKLSEEDAVKLLSVSTRNKCTVCTERIDSFFSGRSQGGFEWVRMKPPPPCNLVKLKFYFLNETAAVRLQSFNRAVVVLLQTAYKPSCSCYTAINTSCKRASLAVFISRRS